MLEWRLGFFLGILGVVTLGEVLRPRREQPQKWHHRAHNLFLVAINAFLLSLPPLALVEAALWAKEHNLGLFSVLRMEPLWAGVFCFFFLDFAIYVQHWAFHRFAWLWPLHRVHHTDLALDSTSGLRFHSLEILLSQLYKLFLVILLGIPPFAVFAFEVFLNAMAMFNHANLQLPKKLEKTLGLLVITPALHLVHHSQIPTEQNKNFGFSFVFWDKLFATFQKEPLEGEKGLKLGVKGWIPGPWMNMPQLLLQPWKKEPK